MMTVSDGGNQDTEALAARLLAEVRAAVARADSKAAVLVAALSLASGLLGVLLANRGWSPGQMSVPGQALWWGGVLSLCTALATLLLAVVPRFPRHRWVPGSPLTYFGDIHDAAARGSLAEALTLTRSEPELALLRALEANSRIALIKLCWIRVGLFTFGTGVPLLAAALFVA